MKYTDEIIIEFDDKKRIVTIMNIDEKKYIDIYPSYDDFNKIVGEWYIGDIDCFLDICDWEDGAGNPITDDRLWTPFEH